MIGGVASNHLHFREPGKASLTARVGGKPQWNVHTDFKTSLTARWAASRRGGSFNGRVNLTARVGGKAAKVPSLSPTSDFDPKEEYR